MIAGVGVMFKEKTGAQTSGGFTSFVNEATLPI